MDSRRFITGLGIGMVAGGTLGMILAPNRKRMSRNTVSRALRGVSDVVDGVADVFRS